MKKLTSLLLALIMTITVMMSSALSVSATSFKDVKKSDWFYDSVNYVADKGIMKGTSSTEFAPNTTLSRAMAVTLLYRIAKTPSVSGVKLPFGDVKSGQWYTDAVKWAYDNGVVKGKSSTVFGTNDNITRAEFATVLYRYVGYTGLTLPVTRYGYVSDLGEIPSWAYSAVVTLYMGEVVNGKEGNIFDSFSNVSRAEAAAMVERFMKNATDAPPISDGEGGKIESDPIPTTGNVVVKEKKYNYDGAHVMILNVENQTDKSLTLTITGHFKDANGKELKSETQTFEGFSANCRNYFVFRPGIKFDSFTYEVKAAKFSGNDFLKYITYSTNVNVYAWASPDDFNGDGKSFPPGEERAAVCWDYRVYNEYVQEIYTAATYVLFDKNGEIYAINDGRNGSMNMPSRQEDNISNLDLYLDILYKDFELPKELKGNCTGIIAFSNVQDYIFININPN